MFKHLFLFSTPIIACVECYVGMETEKGDGGGSIGAGSSLWLGIHQGWETATSEIKKVSW